MFSQRRLIGLVVAALLHVLLIYGLVSGLATQVVERFKGPVQIEIIEEVKPEDETPPPPPPDLPPPPPVTLPPPIVSIDTPVTTTTPTITVTPPRPRAPPPPPPPVREAVCTQPIAPKRRTPPPYPSTSKRLGEEGNVEVSFTVDADGSVNDAAPVTVTKGSGFPRLDEAGIRAVRRMRFTPAKCDGVPKQSPHAFRVVYRLDEA